MSRISTDFTNIPSASFELRGGPHVEGVLSIHDPRLKQVDDGFLSGVLEFLQAGDGNRDRRLANRVLRRSEDLRGSDIQRLVAAVPLALMLLPRPEASQPLRVDFSGFVGYIIAGGLTVASPCGVLSLSRSRWLFGLPPCRPCPGVQVNQREFRDVP